MRILFVCLGNICRSPMAEGIMRHLDQDASIFSEIDSAGTSGEHTGERPDRRAVKCLGGHGIEIDSLRSRKFQIEDFSRFDLILTMDTSNQSNILRLAKNDNDRSKVQLFMDSVSPQMPLSVPDPWYGDQQGFEEVYEMLDGACRQWIAQLSKA